MPSLFKQRMLAREIQVGIVAGVSDPYCTDILGGAPFDWVLIDGEHSPVDPTALTRQLQVLHGHRREVAFRPGHQPGQSLGQWLDIGVRTLVVPNVESAEEARELVAATRYPPEGRRGVGPTLARAAAWGRQQDYLLGANDGICVVAQVESAAGVAAIDRIAAVAGIEGILLGPSDLAASLGCLGNAAHPDVAKAIEFTIQRSLALGRAVGMFVSDIASALRYRQLGCTFFIVGTDTRLYARALDEAAVSFQQALKPRQAEYTART